MAESDAVREAVDLKGKYYRTTVFFELEDGRVVTAELTSSDPKPSLREVAGNVLAWETGELPCDGHYERDATWRVVSHLRRALGDYAWDTAA